MGQEPARGDVRAVREGDRLQGARRWSARGRQAEGHGAKWQCDLGHSRYRHARATDHGEGRAARSNRLQQDRQGQAQQYSENAPEQPRRRTQDLFLQYRLQHEDVSGRKAPQVVGRGLGRRQVQGRAVVQLPGRHRAPARDRPSRGRRAHGQALPHRRRAGVEEHGPAPAPRDQVVSEPRRGDTARDRRRS